MGVLTLFLFLFGGEGDILIDPSPIFLEHWALPYKNPKWQNRNTFALPYGLSFQFMYMGVELWTNNMR